jgi:Protochlamydia outer membrane protein
MKRTMALCVLGAAIVVSNGAASGPESRVDVGLGYRSAKLDWNIAGQPDGTAPNVLSELEWTHLQMIDLDTRGSVTFRRGVRLIGSATYSLIFSGDGRDSDYAGDNRTVEWSRSTASGDSGHAIGGSLGVGYEFVLIDRRTDQPRTRICPKLGLAYDQQKVRLTDGVQVVSDPANAPVGVIAPGPFSGLNSSYRTAWQGPYVGIEVETNTSPRSRLRADVEYHRADYSARANWNLRDDLAHPKSFEHEADADGWVVSLGFRLTNVGWNFLHVRLRAERWTTDAGTDRVFTTDGDVGVTRLNEAEWTSFSLLIGRDFAF